MMMMIDCDCAWWSLRRRDGLVLLSRDAAARRAQRPELYGRSNKDMTTTFRSHLLWFWCELTSITFSGNSDGCHGIPAVVLFSLLPAMCLEYDQQNWLHVLCLSRRGYRTPKSEFFAGERVTLFSQTSKVRKIGAHSQSARINPYPRNEKPKHAHKGNLLSFLPLCPACCAFSNQPKISRISEGLAESMRWGK